jgi:hypothetical protein
VHRDVSPSNILISFRGDVKIGDFGIALVQQESKTQAGVLKGKFGYMSPEQVAGLNVDHRSDIFAAGIVLAELLLGRRLFLGSSDFETLDKVMNVRLDVLEEHESALSPEAVRIVRQALMRDVNDRYQSAREFYEDINEHLYQQGHRISNETLAAFIAEHVSPFLEPYKGSENSSSISSPVIHPGQAVRSSSGQHRAPMVSSQIIPDAVEPVSPKITIEEPAPDELQHLPSQSGEIMGDDQVPRRRSQSSQELARISLKKAPVEPAAEPPVIVDESMVDDFIGEEFPTEEPFPAEAPAQAGPDPAHAAPEPPGPPAYIDLPDEEEAPKGTDIPMDHPAFGSMPMLEIGEEEPIWIWMSHSRRSGPEAWLTSPTARWRGPGRSSSWMTRWRTITGPPGTCWPVSSRPASCSTASWQVSRASRVSLLTGVRRTSPACCRRAR